MNRVRRAPAPLRSVSSLVPLFVVWLLAAGCGGGSGDGGLSTLDAAAPGADLAGGDALHLPDGGPRADAGRPGDTVAAADLHDDAPDAPAPGDGGGPGDGMPVRIRARAVDTCGTWRPDPRTGVNTQTPTHLRVGVLSVALLRSHRDAAPVPLPVADAPREVDLSAGGALVDSAAAAVPPGAYSHLRVGLAWSRYDLRARARPYDVMGTLSVDMTLADHTAATGGARRQGDWDATFSAFGRTATTRGVTLMDCRLSAWGGIVDPSDGGFVVTVPVPDGPLIVGEGGTARVDLELVFPLQDTFTWRDLDQAGFESGVYDIDLPPAPSELPDRLFECSLLLADRCQGEGIAPVHPTWPMPDCQPRLFSDGERVVAACPDPGQPGFGQDSCYQVNAPDFETAADVVTDRVTGLVWQRAVPPDEVDWWEARAFCADLVLAGAADWRLPSRVELVTLLEYSRVTPTIDTAAFPDTPSAFFWSSSPVPFSNLAFGVRFELGFIYDHDPYGSGRVRCVRGSYTPPSPRFEVTDEVVVDRGTGLVWQRAPFPTQLAWLDALAACEDLALAGHDDWRLPTLKETQTIVDDRELEPSIDVAAFPDTPPEWFWSSTVIEWPPDQGWATSYTDGYASIHDFAEQQRVRCVRQGAGGR